MRFVALHYDDSSRDDWALAWFSDPTCKNGYTWLVLDDGSVVELADPGMRSPHAGACRTPMANSTYFGIAAATNGQVLATADQIELLGRGVRRGVRVPGVGYVIRASTDSRSRCRGDLDAGDDTDGGD